MDTRATQWMHAVSVVAAHAGLLVFIACGSRIAAASAAVDATSAFMVLPVVAQTASFGSEVTVFNPHPDFDLVLGVQYVGGDGTPAAGVRSCGSISLPALRAVQFNVGTKCSLAVGNFGMLRISDSGSNGNGIPLPFHAYSRVANPQGIGFSVPAYPNAVFESGSSEVIGLKRQSAAPGYQSNCFIGSRDDPSTLVQIALYSASNVQIGNTLSRVLGPNELVRYLDVFAAVGAPAGDYSNVRAEFSTFVGTALIAFCTVQDNTSFGADFRIAGESEPHDVTRQFYTSTGDAGWSFPTPGQKAVFNVAYRAPDRARCVVMGSHFSAIELRVKDPSNTVVAGGNDVWDTGEFAVDASGVWTLEVSVREDVTPPAYPVDYGLDCWSGNGHAQIGVSMAPDDF
ncbi:MAG: hypothetical protein ACM3SX_18390 [Deltaproteobacteria bacterium]